MKKYFKIVAGRKFYCDEKGAFIKDAQGSYEEVPETDTETTELASEDEASAEMQKMLEAVIGQVKTSSKKALDESAVEAVDAMASVFKGFTKAAKKTRVSVEGQGKASYDVDKVKEGLKALYSRQTNSFSFSVTGKSDVEYLAKVTSEAGSLEGDVLEGDRSPEITRDPVRSVFIESIADVVPNMTGEFLSYVECVSESGAPLTTAELAQIPEKDFEFQEFKAHLKKITVMNKHSVEILQDASQLVSAIKGWLNEDVNIETDNQLLNGDGLGQNLDGVFSVASILDDTAVGTKRVAFANLADVIRVAITKIAVAGKGKFNANYVLLNPEDADELDLTKDENGQYVLPPFKTADGTVIKGARIIENVGVPAGEFLVGDFRKLHVGTKGGIQIEMTNSDKDDFGKDILSVKLRRRVASYVRQNDNGAFWTGNIEEVKEALTQS